MTLCACLALGSAALTTAGCTGARVELMNAESPATGPAGVAGSGGTGAAGSFGSGGTMGGTSQEAATEAAGGAGSTTSQAPARVAPR
jgi:hypothetical protein